MFISTFLYFQLFDFRYALQEILEKREEKIRSELENEKRQALSKMETDRYEHEKNVKECLEQMDIKQLVLKCDEEILDSERKMICGKSKQSPFSENSPMEIVHLTKSNLIEEINNIMQTPSKGSVHRIEFLVCITIFY